MFCGVAIAERQCYLVRGAARVYQRGPMIDMHLINNHRDVSGPRQIVGVSLKHCRGLTDGLRLVRILRVGALL
jgi:hypothetical protein